MRNILELFTAAQIDTCNSSCDNLGGSNLSVLLLILISISIGLSNNCLAAGEYSGARDSFGRFHGHGIYTNSRGDQYDGHWQDGRKSGKGVLKKADGEVYRGDWLDNKRHGLGEQVFASGDVYTGEWLANRRTGQGKLEYNNGDVYEGAFNRNKLHGKGGIKYRDGSVFAGLWSEGLKHGSGTYTLKNGAQIKGQWVQGKSIGRGQYKFENGLVFDGPIVNSKPHGNGLCSSPSQSGKLGKNRSCSYNKGVAVEKVALVKNVVRVNSAEENVAKRERAAAKQTASKVARAETAAKKPEKPKPVQYRGNKREFSFQHNWHGKTQTEKSATAWWDVEEGYQNDLQVRSEADDFAVTFNIRNYEGPGIYPLSYYQARVTGPTNKTYASSQGFPGELHITQDNGELISGVFKFDAFLNGNPALKEKLELRKGFFTATKKVN